MINSKQLFKAGRETKIFEVNDNLCVNDFYNETGFMYSNLHGKRSRIQMLIVDITTGKKDKAKVLKFNFTAEEWKELIFLLKQGQNGFSKACKLKRNTEFYGFIKVNKYKVFENNLVEIKKIKISYEKELRKPQWKVAIECAKALPQDNGFGFIPNSYKKLQGSYFLITNEEMIELLKTERYLELWEQFSFPEFILNRNAFEERAKANSYNEDDLTWNNNPNIDRKDSSNSSSINNTKGSNNRKVNKTTYSNTESDTKRNINKPISEKVNCTSNLFCEKCGAKVEEKLAKISKKRWHKVLCANCFNKNK